VPGNAYGAADSFAAMPEAAGRCRTLPDSAGRCRRTGIVGIKILK
jgi:hypothetical protein